MVLSARSEYFKAMFNPEHKFREISDTLYQQQGQNKFRMIRLMNYMYRIFQKIEVVRSFSVRKYSL